MAVTIACTKDTALVLERQLRAAFEAASASTLPAADPALVGQ